MRFVVLKIRDNSQLYLHRVFPLYIVWQGLVSSNVPHKVGAPFFSLETETDQVP
jgi:hypothetical protein